MNDNISRGKKLTHVDPSGSASMVNVGSKTLQSRTAIATGAIFMEADTIMAVRNNQLKKGDVLAVARIAGIQAAKATASLIPLCHTLVLDHISVHFEINKDCIEATCTATCQGKTGVEMEVLTAVSVSLLTIYDMCKAIDKKMEIERIRLVIKEKKDI